MPAAAAIPAIAGLAGGALSALGGSGKQSSVKQSTNQNTTQDISKLENFMQNFSGLNTQTPLEPEYFSAFRQSLIPEFQRMMFQANQPVYGKAQTASFMEGLNDLTNSAIGNLKQTLAKAGAMDSGRFGTGAAQIQMGRLGQATNFMGQLPFMEKQAKLSNLGNVLGMGLNWAGKAPVGLMTTSSGTQGGQSSGTQHSTGNMTGSSEGSQYGPSFGSSFLNSMGGMFGQAASGAGPLGGIAKILSGFKW